ncbi:MAG: hypothetical protein ACOC33_02090 [bacterium]
MSFNNIIELVSSADSELGIIIVLLLILASVLIYRLDIIMSLFKKNKKEDKSKQILTGDIISINSKILIYLFDIHSNYRESLTELKESVLDKQKEYYDQISEQIIDEICESYKKIQENKISVDEEIYSYGDPLKEFLLFKEVLKNAFYTKILKEFERSFKKNGFHDYGDIELNTFVRKKVDILLQNLVKHLETNLPVYNDTLYINPLDSNIVETILNRSYMEEKVLDIYKNARDEYIRIYIKKESQLKSEFQNSINTLILQNIFEVKE